MTSHPVKYCNGVYSTAEYVYFNPTTEQFQRDVIVILIDFWMEIRWMTSTNGVKIETFIFNLNKTFKYIEIKTLTNNKFLTIVKQFSCIQKSII